MDSPSKAKKSSSPAMSRSNSSKFFRCFKPAVVGDDDCGGREENRGPDEPVFAYVAVKENDGPVFHKIAPAGDGDDGSDDRRKNKKGLRLFSRVSKAVFFETSLVKKMQKRRSKKNPQKSISNLSTKADRILKLMHQNSGERVSDNDSAQVTESNITTSSHSSVAATTSASLSSSRSSSINSSLKGGTQSSTQSSSFDSKHIQLSTVEDGKERPSSPENSAIYLLLLTLLVLVFWGKICAIVCTSTWLFLVPRWSIIKCTKSLPEKGDDSPYVDSAEYKKKIILEGLLQRKRMHGTQNS